MIHKSVNMTLIGGPTLLLELGGLRFLTDPTFDPPGGDYDIGVAVLHKLGSPARTAAALGRVDVVLLSHDQHADNLDAAGSAFLPTARTVLTTVTGAARLGLSNTTGLASWQSVEMTGADSQGAPLPVRVTGTPARHGPEGIEVMMGEVTGFILEWEKHCVYISGDTVWFEGVAEVARRFPHIDIAVLFLGGVRQAENQPLLTMDAAEAALVTNALNPQTVIPIHYEGWQHFLEGRESASQAFAKAELAERVIWLEPGESKKIAV